jgi:hypothetical protein
MDHQAVVSTPHKPDQDGINQTEDQNEKMMAFVRAQIQFLVGSIPNLATIEGSKSLKATRGQVLLPITYLLEGSIQLNLAWMGLWIFQGK